MIPSLEINEQFQKAIDLLKNTDKHLFITESRGSGKSTFLEHFIKKNFQEIIVLAPTGVAAVNIKGETIHSFFQI